TQSTCKTLKKYYREWYAPNKAVLVITGDVDPASTLAKIKQYYGPIPRRPVPSHPAINLQPVPANSFTLDSNLPYVLTFISFRFPGTDSPDYATAKVLSDVLSSQRGDLYALVADGKALGTDFSLLESYPKASVAFAAAAVPAGSDPAPITAEIKKILESYVA